MIEPVRRIRDSNPPCLSGSGVLLSQKRPTALSIICLDVEAFELIRVVGCVKKKSTHERPSKK